MGLARDALSAGDRVAAEAYYQHAEHYFRIVNSSTDPATAERRPARSEGNGRDADGREPNGQTQRGQEARGQDSGGDIGPSAGARETVEAAGGTPIENAPSEPQPPREDREGLDRALGKDGAGAGPRARPRPRRRPVRGQEAERSTDTDDADKRAPRPGHSGNGEASIGAPAQGRVVVEADSTTTDQQDGVEITAPREKDQGSEPAGA